jgi:predicted nucleotidyltransferase
MTGFANDGIVADMDGLPIAMPREEIVAFCGRNHIQRLSLFGFILTKRFRDQSDVDLLVEFEPGHVPGLLGIARMEAELSQILGRKADLRTARDLSRPSATTYFRSPCCSIVHIFLQWRQMMGWAG